MPSAQPSSRKRRRGKTNLLCSVQFSACQCFSCWLGSRIEESDWVPSPCRHNGLLLNLGLPGMKDSFSFSQQKKKKERILRTSPWSKPYRFLEFACEQVVQTVWHKSLEEWPLSNRLQRSILSKLLTQAKGQIYGLVAYANKVIFPPFFSMFWSNMQLRPWCCF